MQIDLAIKRDNPLTIGEDRFYIRAAARDLSRRTDFHFSPRFDQTFPTPSIESFQKQEFDFPIVGKSARGKHPGVIENHEIAGAKIAFKVRKHPMLDALIIPVHDHHPRIFAVREWPMGNEMLRQSVIVIGEPRTHRRNHQRDCRVAQKFRM